MSRPKVAVLTESPDDSPRSWAAVEYIIEVLEKEYDVTRLSVLNSEPRNGKKATKTELKNAGDVVNRASQYPFVVLVGNTPLQAITGSTGISRERGRPRKIGKSIMLPVNNPMTIFHDPLQEDVLKSDLELFRSIVKFGGIPEEKELNIRIVQDRGDFLKMLEDLRGTVAFDVETNSLNPFQVTNEDGEHEPAKVTALGFSTARYQWCLGLNSPTAPLTQTEVASWMDELTDVLRDCFIVTHNGKFDMLWMWVHFGVRWRIDFDTMLAHFLLNENMRHGLKYLAMVYLKAPDWEVDLETKKGAGSFLDQAKYLAHDVYYTRMLRFVFGKMLNGDQEVRDVFKHIMIPSANIFVEIEYDGVYIDMNKFEDAEAYLREQYNSALGRLRQWEPKYVVNTKGKQEPFNWGSPKQLGKLLFDDLKLPVIERTAAGGRSCSESVLKRLNHPMVQDLLKFREAKQQLSFFIDGWKPYLHKRSDGYYLHPSFKLHGTVTDADRVRPFPDRASRRS